MRRNKGKYELDMTHGKLIPRVAIFAFPLILTSVLQLLYNAADVVVVGRFAGSESLAAVGSTGPLINLIINVFFGLSVGTNVIAAKHYGAGDYRSTQETVHTSVTISVLGGLALGLIGFLFCGAFLQWMDSPPDVLPLATRYMRIYFIGMPFNMLYNFGAAILRAVGDTRRPLYFLTFAGIVNVALNLFFVINLKMGVAGVALATIISQAISAALVIICMVRSDGFIRLNLKALRIHRDKLRAIVRIGLPAGFQAACFSLSNVLIQSTVNSFGSIVIAGNSASQNIEGFIYVSMNALYQAAITFASANVGAQKYDRIRKTMGACTALVTGVGVALGTLFFLLMPRLLAIYSPDPQVIAAGMVRLRIISITYFLCGIMDVFSGMLRGMGTTLTPMAVSLVGVCAFRIFWIYAVLPLAPSLQMLYYSYPVSWVLTGGAHLFFCMRRMKHFPVSKPA